MHPSSSSYPFQCQEYPGADPICYRAILYRSPVYCRAKIKRQPLPPTANLELLFNLTSCGHGRKSELPKETFASQG